MRLTDADALLAEYDRVHVGPPGGARKLIENAPTIETGPQWIPIRTRPMTEEEREYWEDNTGVELEDEDAVSFDCQMPDDGQEVWVCYKSGTVSEDVCERDDFCGLEGNGDWLDIVAWMPRIKPEPYREGINNDG